MVTDTRNHSHRHSRSAPPTVDASPPPLDSRTLITHNETVLPEVYAPIHATRTAAPTAISSTTGLARQVVHRNLKRLVDAGAVARHDPATYRLIEPALAPTVVQSLSEVGSPLRLDLCGVAVDHDRIVVDEARRAIDLSESNARKILNALAADGYLAKRESRQDEGVLVYRITAQGARALRALEDPAAFCGRDGETVQHHPTGIEGTAFRTAYEVEDAYLIAQRGGTTVADLLAEMDKAEKATRRRLARLTERGLLEETRRRETNVYRPTPRTRTMISGVRECEDDRRLQAWTTEIPDACLKRVPEPFFPEHVFEVFLTLLHDASPELADEYITTWKAAGLIEGNRNSGFRFVHAQE